MTGCQGLAAVLYLLGVIVLAALGGFVGVSVEVIKGRTLSRRYMIALFIVKSTTGLLVGMIPTIWVLVFSRDPFTVTNAVLIGMTMLALTPVLVKIGNGKLLRLAQALLHKFTGVRLPPLKCANAELLGEYSEFLDSDEIQHGLEWALLQKRVTAEWQVRQAAMPAAFTNTGEFNAEELRKHE